MLGCDVGIGSGHLDILNFTRLIVVGANGSNCIVLCSDIFIFLEDGCYVFMLYVRHVEKLIGELYMDGTLITSFDALVLCVISKNA